MLQLHKNYEIVDGKNQEFNNIFEPTWKKLGVTTEIFKQSDRLLIRNKKNEAVATIEFVKYDKGYEHEELEEAFPFSRYQSEDIQLLYIDKLALVKDRIGMIQNIQLLIDVMFDFILNNQTNKRTVVVASIQKNFYRHLKRFVNVKIIELSGEINGEIPILIDSEQNKDVLKNKKWSKFNF